MLPTAELIAIAVRILLEYGLPWILDFNSEKKAELERRVKSAVPRLSRWIPERTTDQIAWKIVEGSLDIILEVVRARLGGLGLVEAHLSQEDECIAVAVCVSEVEKRLAA